jgi:hypothetical protein
MLHIPSSCLNWKILKKSEKLVIGSGTAYPSVAPYLTPVFSGVHVAQSLVIGLLKATIQFFI